MSATEDKSERPRLLVVDENPDSREYLQACLEREHYEVAGAASGCEGLSKAHQEPPDVLLLDIDLKDMDALEVCRALKANAATRTVAVIVLSTQADEAQLRAALAAGADDFLLKPFKNPELIVRAAACIQKQRAAAASYAGAAESDRPAGAALVGASGMPHQTFFNDLSDGMLVMDADLRVTYLNGAAATIIGHTAGELAGQRLLDRLDAQAAQAIQWIFDHLGPNRQACDGEITITRPDGSSVVLAVRAGIPKAGATFLLTLRDVTAERRIADELRRTKHFLENLIDTSVDAIVAADLNGLVIVFNKGAERILGYPAEEVVGKIHVSQLYPPGVAQEIMHQLRQDRGGGIGRLNTSRKEALSRNGEVIPIQLTAWSVMEGGKEVATAGIFHDLRERLGIERKLSQAQEKLMKTEKQAMIAELAGATAHELNQPLTSVLGYAELAKRKLKDPEEAKRILDIIITETERMADIVRKIGHITRYETKSYVGQQRIVDLDRSSEPE